MIWYSAFTLILLVNPTLGFTTGRATERPHHSSNQMTSKHRKPPTHISEFTDPDTGLNPFLDIEEGQTSMGRNAVEDEIIDDTPYFDLDLVEGDASNRRLGFSEPKDTSGKVPAIGRWPAVDYKDENFDFPQQPTTQTPASSTAIFKVTEAKESKVAKADNSSLIRGLQSEEKDQRKTTFESRSSVIYAAASIVSIATVALLIGACWWKKKIKTSQSAVRVVKIEVKS